MLRALEVQHSLCAYATQGTRNILNSSGCGGENVYSSLRSRLSRESNEANPMEMISQQLTDITVLSIVVRILLSTFCAGTLGFERERHN